MGEVEEEEEDEDDEGGEGDVEEGFNFLAFILLFLLLFDSLLLLLPPSPAATMQRLDAEVERPRTCRDLHTPLVHGNRTRDPSRAEDLDRHDARNTKLSRRTNTSPLSCLA